MLNYMNKYVYLPKMVPLKQGSRDFMGIRGVWGGVRYDRDVVMAPPNEALTKKMFLPPTMVSGWEGVGSK